MWCHKNEISEIMGFVWIFWKNNVQEAYLPKMSFSGQTVPEIVAQLCLENSIQTLLNFFGSTPQKIRRVCMEFSEYNRLTSQRQFAPKCSFLVSRPLGHCSFRISWQIPATISEISFLWRHHFSTLWQSCRDVPKSWLPAISPAEKNLHTGSHYSGKQWHGVFLYM